MSCESEKPKIYWQVGNGEKHSIPEGADVYVWDDLRKHYVKLSRSDNGAFECKVV